MKPTYGVDTLKFATDRGTLARAITLYESGKVQHFKEEALGFSAVVLGSHPSTVYVSAKQYDAGTCTCYLGQNDTLCKHMVAVALWAVKDGKPMSDEEKHVVTKPMCSGRSGLLGVAEMKETKAAISAAMRHIKPYEGPSRIWFAYQDSLLEGCNRLSAIVSDLPVSEQTAKVLVHVLLRLDEKLSIGGVDDSDGTVGGFIENAVEVLGEYGKLDASCTKAFRALEDRETSFGWEEPLLAYIKSDVHINPTG